MFKIALIYNDMWNASPYTSALPLLVCCKLSPILPFRQTQGGNEDDMGKKQNEREREWVVCVCVGHSLWALKRVIAPQLTLPFLSSVSHSFCTLLVFFPVLIDISCQFLGNMYNLSLSFCAVQGGFEGGLFISVAVESEGQVEKQNSHLLHTSDLYGLSLPQLCTYSPLHMLFVGV